MAYWKQPQYQKKELLSTLGDGINSGPPFQIQDTEATYLRNMDSWKYPSVAVRPGRSTYAVQNSSNAHTIGQRANYYHHIVDGNTWKYWVASTAAYTTLTTTLSSTEGRFGEFATGTNRYTIFMNSTQKLLWDGTSTVATLGDANTPFTKIFTIHKGRIYAARANDIYYSALNKTSDWTTANDAGTIDVTRAKGNISGMCEFNDHVIVFTEYSMHELYGSGPRNFELIDVQGEIGCISDRSITKCNGKLYWLWYDGVYRYTGGVPEKISDPFVNEYIKKIPWEYRTKCVSGSIGDFLYIAIPYGLTATENNIILKYDTRLGKWFVDTGNFKDFVTASNIIFGLDNTGQMWNMRNEISVDDGGVPISWELITKPFNKMPEDKQTITDMYLVADVSTGSTDGTASTFNVGYSTNAINNDSTTFTTLTSLSPSTNPQNVRIQIPTSSLQNTDWYRLKFSGTGQATIHYLQKNVRIKR